MFDKITQLYGNRMFSVFMQLAIKHCQNHIHLNDLM